MPHVPQEFRKAFTLIELLIVVAIIAILAAIAVPNFLEAQTRAKVSRVKADIRSLVTALESYRVDNNRFPYDNLSMPRATLAEGPETQFDRRTLNYWSQLTTPIAYITSILNDTFRDKRQDGEVTNFPSKRNYFWPHTQDLANAGWYGTNTAADREYIDLVHHNGDEGLGFYSVGPDNAHYTPYAAGGNIIGGVSEEFSSYDPSNGTVSNGNILWNNRGIRMNW